MGEGGGDVVAILGDLQYNTIQRGGRWRRRGSDPWGPTIQYNATWGKVEETW